MNTIAEQGEEIVDLLKGGFAVVDTEDNGKGKVYLYGVYSREGFKHFVTSRDLIAYIGKLKVRYILCYNLQYDAFNIFGYKILNMDGFYINNRLAKFRAVKKIWLCAYNHWLISIADAGNELGISKLKADYSKRVSIEYLKHDCLIGYKYAEKMLAVYNDNNIPYRITIASTALHHFLNYTSINPALDKWCAGLYDGFYGGRVSCFRIGAYKDCYKYDINSAYPYAMAMNKYPYPLTLHYGIKLHKSGMTCATVYSDLSIPVLPYRDANGYLYYPNGEFTGTWCNNELQYFLSVGGKILKRHTGVYFNNDVPVFKEYMLMLYQKRLEAKTYFSRYTWKLFLNGIYGKFSQRGIDNRIVTINSALRNNLDGVLIGDNILVSRIGKRPNHSNVIWSAMITANVRIYLHQMLTRIGAKHILYCDTDSIITDRPIPGKFIHQTELGKFKFEGKANCHITAPKMYSFGKDVKVKGIPKRLTAEQGLQASYTFDRPIKLFEGIRRGIRPNTWISQTKKLSGTLRNYKVVNGIVKPLILKGEK